MIEFLKEWSTKRGQRFFIYDRAYDPNSVSSAFNPEVYMIRYILFKCKWFGVYLHEFYKSDDEVHHDHPWDFFTLILKGGYNEEIINLEGARIGSWGPFNIPIKYTRKVKRWQMLYRKAEHIHRVILTDSKPVTLSVLFRKRREWGFWVPGKYSGNYYWSHWRKFLNTPTGENKEQRM